MLNQQALGILHSTPAGPASVGNLAFTTPAESTEVGNLAFTTSAESAGVGTLLSQHLLESAGVGDVLYGYVCRLPIHHYEGGLRPPPQSGIHNGA